MLPLMSYPSGRILAKQLSAGELSLLLIKPCGDAEGGRRLRSSKYDGVSPAQNDHVSTGIVSFTAPWSQVPQPRVTREVEAKLALRIELLRSLRAFIVVAPWASSQSLDRMF